MPLITKFFPTREKVRDSFQNLSLQIQQQAKRSSLVEQTQQQTQQQKQQKQQKQQQLQLRDSGYYDQQEEYDQAHDDADNSDMSDSMLHRPRPQKPAKAPVVPALPPRSEKRISKFLGDVTLELKALKALDAQQGHQQETMDMVQETDPHELYLSSEEDASLSDDYEDSLLDFEDDYEESTAGSASAAPSRKSSREDTARAVSFVSAGKPQIVEIQSQPGHSPSTSTAHDIRAGKGRSMAASTATAARRSIKTAALEAPAAAPASSSSKTTQKRPAPLKLNNLRRMSVSSTYSSISTASAPPMPTAPPASASSANASTSTLPLRKSNRLAHLTSLVISSNKHRSSKPASSLSPAPVSRSASPSSRPMSGMPPATRSSSAMYSLPSAASSTFTTNSPAFLSSDPFPQETSLMLPPSPALSGNFVSDALKTPRTAARESWKKSLTRTLSKARKPSMPKLKDAFNVGTPTSATDPSDHSRPPRATTSHGASNGAPLSRITSNPEPPTPKLFVPEEMRADGGERGDRILRTSVSRSQTMPVQPSPREQPASWGAARVPPPIPVVNSRGRHTEARKSFSMGLGRRKSIKSVWRD